MKGRVGRTLGALALAWGCAGCAGGGEALITGPPANLRAEGPERVSRAELMEAFERARQARANGHFDEATAELEQALERPMGVLMRMETHALLGVIHDESGHEEAARRAASHHDVVISLWRSWGDRMRDFDPETNMFERRRARSLAARASYMKAGVLRARAEQAPLRSWSIASLRARLELERDAIEAYDEVITLARDAPSSEQAWAWVAASHYAVGQMLEHNADAALREGLRAGEGRGLELDMASVAVQMRAEAARRYRKAWAVRRADPETQQWRALARQRLCALSGCR